MFTNSQRQALEASLERGEYAGTEIGKAYTMFKSLSPSCIIGEYNQDDLATWFKCASVYDFQYTNKTTAFEIMKATIENNLGCAIKIVFENRGMKL